MPGSWLSEFAPAKVNLYLHVTGRRADLYHLLDSLAVFPAVGDRLRATPAEALSLTVEGPFGAALAGETDNPETDNLVLRAARALGGTAGARIVLEKHLPVASGIGGGSADAAAALRLLCRLWGLPRAAPPVAPARAASAPIASTPAALPPAALTTPGLAQIALTLGADVPVCLASRPARMGGVGETLTPAPGLPPAGMVLVNPGAALATAAVFRARAAEFSKPAELPASWPDAAAMANDLAKLRNDLQPPAIALLPVIGTVLAALAAVPGCLLARMSGSGATCFGLFPDASTAGAAARALARPGWWCWGGALGRPERKALRPGLADLSPSAGWGVAKW